MHWKSLLVSLASAGLSGALAGVAQSLATGKVNWTVVGAGAATGVANLWVNRPSGENKQ